MLGVKGGGETFSPTSFCGRCREKFGSMPPCDQLAIVLKILSKRFQEKTEVFSGVFWIKIVPNDDFLPSSVRRTILRPFPEDPKSRILVSAFY